MSPLRKSPRLAAHCRGGGGGSQHGSRSKFVQINLFGRKPASTAAQGESKQADKRTSTDEAHAVSLVEDDYNSAVSSEAEVVMPELASMERKRAQVFKRPAGPRGRMKASRVTKQTKVSLSERLQQFPDQGLYVSGGKLFCGPCREEAPNLKESLKRHCASQKHEQNLVNYNLKVSKGKEAFKDIASWFEANPDLKGVRMHVCE